jgi:hypothetical protein
VGGTSRCLNDPLIDSCLRWRPCRKAFGPCRHPEAPRQPRPNEPGHPPAARSTPGRSNRSGPNHHRRPPLCSE